MKKVEENELSPRERVEVTLKHTKDTILFVELGYVGIEKIHKNSIIPIKSSKNHKLNDD